MVNHQLFLNKLRAFGVGKRSVEWIQSYLLNRYQFVSVNGVSSEKLCIQSGVPQGSVLGPLLFIVFINDLPQMVQDSVVDIFADDTTLSHASHLTNVNATHCALQTSVDNLVKWSDDNFMVLNSTKTKSMLVTGERLKKKLTSDHQLLRINIDGKQIEQVKSQNLWGVIIDDELSFDEHIDKFTDKLAQHIALLNKMSNYLPLRERIVYYNATVKSIMMYGSNVWPNTSKEYLKHIAKLQKRAARVILGASTRTRGAFLFKELGWISFVDEVKIRKAMVCYNRLNVNCPPYNEKLLRTNSEHHQRNTRYSNYLIRKPNIKRAKEGGRTFAVVAAVIWNELPITIRKAPSLKAFKFKYLSLIRNNFYSS